MNELQKQLDKINQEINELKIRKQLIENEIIANSSNFLEKFKIWYNNDSESHHEWYLDKDTFPLMNAMVSDREYRRGETIDLERLFGDEAMFLLLDEGAITEYGSEEEFLLALEEYLPVAKEAMDNDVKSFKLDW